MPHSMQGTRGQVRFRGKLSPKWRRLEYQRQRDEYTKALLSEARQLRKEIEAEKGKTVVSRVKEKVKGFTSRLFRRGVR